MTENSKETKKWLLLYEKMGRNSDIKKKLTSKEFLNVLKEAHDEAYND